MRIAKMELYMVILALTALFSQNASALSLGSLGPQNHGQSQLVPASFDQTWSRYPSPDSIIDDLQNKFPDADAPVSLQPDCLSLGNNNRTLLGDSNPSTGSAAVSNPNSSFANWYMNCLTQYVIAENKGMAGALVVYNPDGSMTDQTKNPPFEKVQKYLTPKVVAECHQNHDPANLLQDQPDGVSYVEIYCPWSGLSDEAKKTLISSYIKRYIGPESVLIDYGIAPSEDALVQSIMQMVNKENEQSTGAFLFLTQNQPISSGTMTVPQAVLIIQFLINIKDTLKF